MSVPSQRVLGGL